MIRASRPKRQESNNGGAIRCSYGDTELANLARYIYMRRKTKPLDLGGVGITYLIAFTIKGIRNNIHKKN